MSDLFGGIFAGMFLAYLVTCAVITPVVAISMAVQVRDCHLVSGSDCRWHLIPDDKLTGNEWRGVE